MLAVYSADNSFKNLHFFDIHHHLCTNHDRVQLLSHRGNFGSLSFHYGSRIGSDATRTVIVSAPLNILYQEVLHFLIYLQRVLWSETNIPCVIQPFLNLDHPLSGGEEHTNDVNRPFPRWPFGQRLPISRWRDRGGLVQPPPAATPYADIYGFSLPGTQCRACRWRVHQSIYHLALDVLRPHYLGWCHVDHDCCLCSRDIPSSSPEKEGPAASQGIR